MVNSNTIMEISVFLFVTVYLQNPFLGLVAAWGFSRGTSWADEKFGEKEEEEVKET